MSTDDNTLPVLAQITVVYAMSPAFESYLLQSLATLPPSVKVIVAWCGDEASKPTFAAYPELEFVVIRNMGSNFCKAYALNVAVRRVRTTHVMIADADMLFPSVFFKALPPALDNLTVYRAFIARFTREKSLPILANHQRWDGESRMFGGRREAIRGRRILERIAVRTLKYVCPELRILYPECPIDYIEIYCSPNPSIYPCALFDVLRGYDERHIGWGFEDEDLYLRGLKQGAKELRLPVVVGHLWHDVPTDYVDYMPKVRHRFDEAIIVNLDGWGDLAKPPATRAREN